MGNDGGYELYILKVGEVETSRHIAYLNLHLAGLPDKKFTMNFYFWVVRDEHRVVLVDTGFSADGALRRGRHPLADTIVLLAQIGIEPDDVDTIVISHLHYDHAGNVARFPRARVAIAADELEFWESPDASRNQFAPATDFSDIEAIRRARDEGRLETFTGSTIVAPRIKAIQVGGHSPGQAIVTVTTAEGDFVIASDAAHFYEELEHDLLFTVMPDVLAGYRAFDVMRGLERDGAHILAGHDVEGFGRHPPDTTGPWAGLIAVIGASAPHGAR